MMGRVEASSGTCRTVPGVSVVGALGSPACKSCIITPTSEISPLPRKLHNYICCVIHHSECLRLLYFTNNTIVG